MVWFKFRGAAEAFQLDADVIRLRHLKHYGQLIQEYREKTGEFPYQGAADVPIYVNIANDQQIAYTKGGPPYAHKQIPVAEFISKLESGLGRPIEERYDPQFRPVHKPNFYIYMVHKDYYFFAVHLYQPFPFAKKVGENYYKVEISNMANEQNKAHLPQELFASPDFTKAIEAPVSKPGFFAGREKQYERFTKQEQE